MSDFEKIQFMQFEYDWQKKRLDDLYNKTNMMLGWNGAIFVFAIAFTDIDKIIQAIKNYENYPTNIIVIISLFVILLSLVLVAISTVGFINCAYMKSLMCFQIQDNIEHDFDINEIIDDYKTIIIDYDSLIKRISNKIGTNINIMIAGVSVLIIFEIILRFLVA